MQSLSRALTVLAELNRQDRPYGVTELAATIGLHKSTVHRILATFCHHGLARRVDHHLYCAADGLSALRPTTTPQPDLLAEAANRLNCLVVLARPLPRTAGTVLEVSAVAGRGELSAGDAVPLRGSALGRAYLAGLPTDQVDSELHDTLQRVREVGFAHNARPVAALPRMVAVPVRDGSGSCVGALGAELPVPASLAGVRRCLPVLHRTASQLGATLSDTLLRRGA